MINQAPDLELAAPPPAPPDAPGGDGLPERDWAVIGLLTAILVLGTYIVQDAARALYREFRR